VPSFVTGHSLGGVAATLYSQSKGTDWGFGEDGATHPLLVTFGAPPTFYTGRGPPDGVKIECMSQKVGAQEAYGYGNEIDVRRLTFGADDDYSKDVEDFGKYCEGDDETGYKMSVFGFELYQSDFSFASPCDLAPPLSVRFVHKFDPAGSIAMWEGTWAHTVQNVMMVSDEIGLSCMDTIGDECSLSAGVLDTSEGESNSIWDLGLDGTNPYLIDSFLCTSTGTTPISVSVSCEQSVTSYMSMGVPDPCSWITTMKYWEPTVGTLPASLQYMDWAYAEKGEGMVEVMGVSRDIVVNKIFLEDLAYSLFMEFESYTECLASWFSTVKAHYPLALIAMPETLGLLFTFSFTHSSYGLYPLCTTTDKNGEIGSLIPEGSGVDYSTSSCDTSEEQECRMFCDDFSEPGCMSCCLQNGCSPCARGSGGYDSVRR
jgi:hypothetical protein